MLEPHIAPDDPRPVFGSPRPVDPSGFAPRRRRVVANRWRVNGSTPDNTGTGMDLTVFPGDKAEKKAAFSCLHKVCELRRWQRRVDVPERSLVLRLPGGGHELAHRDAIERAGEADAAYAGGFQLGNGE